MNIYYRIQQNKLAWNAFVAVISVIILIFAKEGSFLQGFAAGALGVTVVYFFILLFKKMKKNKQ